MTYPFILLAVILLASLLVSGAWLCFALWLMAFKDFTVQPGERQRQ